MKAHVERVEVHPVSMCTLACLGCQHGAPQLPPRTYRPEEYRVHLDRLAGFARWDSVTIGGGEPFLHPDLAGFILGVAFGFPFTPKVNLITNGFWLLREDWWEFAGGALSLCDHIVISRYPPYVDRLGVVEWDRRAGLIRERTSATVGSFHGTDPADLTFTQNDFHHEPRPVIVPYLCEMRHCLQVLVDGRVAKCPLGLWHRRIPNATEEFIASADASMFWDIANDDAEAFGAWANGDTIKACSFCGIGTGALWGRKWSSDTRLRGDVPKAEYERIIHTL